MYIVSRHRTLDRDYLATEEKATGSNRQCWAGLGWAGLVVDRNQSGFGGKLKCPTQHQHTNHRHFLTSKIFADFDKVCFVTRGERGVRMPLVRGASMMSLGTWSKRSSRYQKFLNLCNVFLLITSTILIFSSIVLMSFYHLTKVKHKMMK